MARILLAAAKMLSLEYRLVVVALVAAMSSLATAGVYFDVSPVVAGQDVPTAEFAAAEPHEKLVRIEVHVSLLLTAGRSPEVAGCLYHFYFPLRRCIVVDYLPQTTLATDVVGNLQVKVDDENSRSFQATLSGQYQSALHGNLGGGTGRRHSATTTYEQLPPQELVAAAGTSGRGTGVYFKLRSSPQAPLEGSRTFVIVARVPHDWRSDYLRVVCQAQLAVPGKSATTTSRPTSFLVPLYGHGDQEAQSLSEQLHRAELALLATARQQHDRVYRAGHPTPFHELSLIDPAIPDDWLKRVLYAPPNGKAPDFQHKLPATVREAAEDYQRSLAALCGLSDSPPTKADDASDNTVTVTAETAEPVASAAWSRRESAP